MRWSQLCDYYMQSNIVKHNCNNRVRGWVTDINMIIMCYLSQFRVKPRLWSFNPPIHNHLVGLIAWPGARVIQAALAVTIQPAWPQRPKKKEGGAGWDEISCAYIYIYTHTQIHVYTYDMYIYIYIHIIHLHMYTSLSLSLSPYIYIYIEREGDR